MTGVSEWVKKSDITTAAFPQWTLSHSLPRPHPSPNNTVYSKKDLQGFCLHFTLIPPAR